MPRLRPRFLLAIALTLSASFARPATAAEAPEVPALPATAAAVTEFEVLLCLLDDLIGSGVRRPVDSLTTPAMQPSAMRLSGASGAGAVRVRLMALREQLLRLVAAGQVDGQKAAPVLARIEAALATLRE